MMPITEYCTEILRRKRFDHIGVQKSWWCLALLLFTLNFMPHFLQLKYVSSVVSMQPYHLNLLSVTFVVKFDGKEFTNTLTKGKHHGSWSCDWVNSNLFWRIVIKRIVNEESICLIISKMLNDYVNYSYINCPEWS